MARPKPPWSPPRVYHHLTAEQGDPYLLQLRLNVDSLERLNSVAGALRKVIARHDSLRTAVVWEGLETPQQVVWREAELVVERVPYAQIDAEAGSARMDLSHAPLIRPTLLFHHIVVDATSLQVMREEMLAHLRGEPGPVQPAVPYRNYVAQARLGVSEAEHEAYFREQLGDIDEPTLPFGLLDVQGDGRSIEEAQQLLPDEVLRRLRSQARQLGVASLLHVAWGRVLAAATGHDRVVFGTVLLGRLQGGAGADRGMGMFINTLPLRIDLHEVGVRDAARFAGARTRLAGSGPALERGGRTTAVGATGRTTGCLARPGNSRQ